MVVPGDAAQLRAAMSTFIGDEPARLAAGRRAYESARAFDVHAYARRLSDIYQRIAPVAEMREIGMNAVSSFAGFMKNHVLGQMLIRRNPYYYDRSANALRRHGVEPLFTR